MCFSFNSVRFCVITVYSYVILCIIRKVFLSAVHGKLTLSVSFCVRKIKTNSKFYRTSAGKSTFRTQKTPTRLTFGIQRRKNIVLDTKYFILSTVHRKLTLSVAFCVRKIKTNSKFYCTSAENQLSTRKTTPTRLTFGIQRIKNIVRITCGTYLSARVSRNSFLR